MAMGLNRRSDAGVWREARRLLLPLAVAGALMWGSSADGRAQQARSLVNRPAPEFSLPDLEHARIDLAQYRGKVVLLNFWATWCAPCRTEIPRLVEWQRQLGGQGFQVIGVSIDDSEPPVRDFADQRHVNYPVVMGDAKLGERYGGILGVPVTFLIDRRGIVRARLDGGLDPRATEMQIRKLLVIPPAESGTMLVGGNRISGEDQWAEATDPGVGW